LQTNFRLSRSDQTRCKTLTKNLQPWFDQNQRPFPWRSQGSSIFNKIVCEILLQRTRAETVAAIYPVFFTRFNDWKSIDNVTLESLEEILKPLGIWRKRAKALKSLAKKMIELNQQYPKERTKIEKLPAVGQYVANAIELFDRDLPRPLLDTNMARIIERYFRPRKLADIRHDPWLQSISHFIVGQGSPIEINWALLDLGAITCKPRNPHCYKCPVKRGCSWKKRLSKPS